MAIGCDYLAVGTWNHIDFILYRRTCYGFADCTFNIIVLAKLGDIFPTMVPMELYNISIYKILDQR